VKQYWLMKSEPSVYSILDLKKDQVTEWDGVRNYQARNFMRDTMQLGDGVFFYHSNAGPKKTGIAGEAEVVKIGYPDDTAWDKESLYFDAKTKPEQPIWFMVDVRFIRTCRSLITLKQLKTIPELNRMPVVQKGNRLSVQPVSAEDWAFIMRMEEWA
jgi:predicted RNA-binding protein with PUA-like domain